MNAHGHWFCDRCDDVVILPMPDASTVIPTKCPVCHHPTARFVSKERASKQSVAIAPKKAPPAQAATSHEYFELMRALVDAAPEQKPISNHG